MPELRTIVQRMIDAGEDESTIHAAIDKFNELNPPKPVAPPQQKPVVAGSDLPKPIPGQGVKRVSDEESATFEEGVLNSLVNGEALGAGLRGGLGFLRGAIADIPETLWTGLKDLGEVVSNPGILSQAGEAYREGLPVVGRAIAETAANAGNDPHAFGRMMGQITGQPAVMGKITPPVVKALGRPVEAIGRLGRQYQPLTGLIPRVAQIRTLRNIERGLGGMVERTGQRMRGTYEPPIPTATQGAGADYGNIQGAAGKTPGFWTKQRSLREPFGRTIDVNEAGGIPSRNQPVPYKPNPIQQDIEGAPGEFVTPEPVEGNILAKPPQGTATRNQSVPFENQGPRPVPEPGGPPGEFDLTQPITDTPAVQPDFSGRTPSRYQSVPYEPGPVTDPLADLPSVGKNQRMPSGVREFDFGEPIAEPINLTEPVGGSVPSRFRDMPYTMGQEAEGVAEAAAAGSKNVGGRLTGARAASTDEVMAQAVNDAFAEAEKAPGVELPPPDYSQGAGAPPEQPRVDIKTHRTPAVGTGEESPYSHMTLEQMEQLLAERKAGRPGVVPPKPAEPTAPPPNSGGKLVTPTEKVTTPSGDVVDPATGELLEEAVSSLDTPVETPESIINASNIPEAAKATLLERINQFFADPEGSKAVPSWAERVAEKLSRTEPPGPEFTPVGEEPPVPGKVESVAESRARMGFEPSLDPNFGVAPTVARGAAARPINPLRPKIEPGQISNQQMNDYLANRARAEAPPKSLFQEPPGGNEFVPVETPPEPMLGPELPPAPESAPPSTTGSRFKKMLSDETGAVGSDISELIAKNKDKFGPGSKGGMRFRVTNPSGEKIGDVSVSPEDVAGIIDKVKASAVAKGQKPPDITNEYAAQVIFKQRFRKVLEENGFTEDQVNVTEWRPPKEAAVAVAESGPRLVNKEGEVVKKTEPEPAPEPKPAKAKKAEPGAVAPTITPETGGRDISKLTSAMKVEEGTNKSTKVPEDSASFRAKGSEVKVRQPKKDFTKADVYKAWSKGGDLEELRRFGQDMETRRASDPEYKELLPRQLQYPLSEGETWLGRLAETLDYVQRKKGATPEQLAGEAKTQSVLEEARRILAEEKEAPPEPEIPEQPGLRAKDLSREARIREAEKALEEAKGSKSEPAGATRVKRHSQKWGGIRRGYKSLFREEYPDFDATETGSLQPKRDKEAFLKRNPWALFEEE